MVSYALAISDGDVNSRNLLIHNIIGVAALVGTIVFLIAALLTPKTPGSHPAAVKG